MTRIAIIGFGEVGGIFARDLRAAGITELIAFDIAPAARARAEVSGATVSPSPMAAAANADLVIVAVTAGSALQAVRGLAGGLAHGPLVLDVNSVSPATKQAAADSVAAAGGRYVEAAVMTSVPPRGLASPMLLGGAHTAEFMALGEPWGMKLTAYSERIGAASSVKMCRSVMIKGLEALTTECMLTARHYGVERDVLASLGDTLPHPDWPELARYVIGRALLHGRRRAEEMREVAHTVADAGLEPLLSDAIARRQDWAADRGAAMGKAGRGAADLPALLDAITAAGRLEAAARMSGGTTMLRLYHAPTAVCAAKVRLVLTEKGLDWEGILIDLSRGDQFKPDYLKLNPNGVVPTLAHEGAVLIESTVINEYLDEAFPATPLRPADALGRAGIRLWTKREDGIHACVNTMTNAIVFTPDLRRKTPEERAARIDGIPDPIRRAKWREIVAEGMDSHHVSDAFTTLARHYASMENALADGPWLAGTAFTLADAGLVSFFMRLKHLQLDFTWNGHFPRVAEWFARCTRRPSYEVAIGRYLPASYVEHYAECGGRVRAAAEARFAEAMKLSSVSSLP